MVQKPVMLGYGYCSCSVARDIGGHNFKVDCARHPGGETAMFFTTSKSNVRPRAWRDAVELGIIDRRQALSLVT